MANDVLLQVTDLNVSFRTKYGVVQAVNDVSFQVRRGQTLGIVGESGCGKSVTSMSVMRLLSPTTSIIHDGTEILFNGEDITRKSKKEMCRLRGEEISMIFQDSMTSLNPVMRIEKQLGEVFRLHCHMNKEQARAASLEMIKKVGMPDPERVLRCYPHQLSGGQRQRVIIAMALACNPSLLLADEPTTALDVTIQMQILEMMKELRKEYDAAIMLITHDMGVVSEMADDVMVMYAGQVVEYAAAKELFARPMHPYTEGLLRSIPKLSDNGERLASIPGTVPNLQNMPTGCRFCDRCPYATQACRDRQPGLYEAGGRKVRCFRYAAKSEEV